MNGNARENSEIHEDIEDDNISSDPTDNAIEGNNNNEAKTNSLNSKQPSVMRKDESANSSIETSPGGSKAIKAKGTYYPLTAFPTNMPQGPVMRKGDESPPCHEPSPGKPCSPILVSIYSSQHLILTGLKHINQKSIYDQFHMGCIIMGDYLSNA